MNPDEDYEIEYEPDDYEGNYESTRTFEDEVIDDIFRGCIEDFL